MTEEIMKGGRKVVDELIIDGVFTAPEDGTFRVEYGNIPLQEGDTYPAYVHGTEICSKEDWDKVLKTIEAQTEREAELEAELAKYKEIQKTLLNEAVNNWISMIERGDMSRENIAKLKVLLT